MNTGQRSVLSVYILIHNPNLSFNQCRKIYNFNDSSFFMKKFMNDQDFTVLLNSQKNEEM
jgi:hypothetical protein